MIKPTDITFACEDHRKMYNALYSMIKSDERPIASKVMRLAGVNDRLLRNISTANENWATEIRQLINQEHAKWLEHGGMDCKKIEKILNKFIKDGKKPIVAHVLDEAGRHREYFVDPIYPWKSVLREKIKKAYLKWKQNGGADYRTIKKALNQMIEEGKQKPTIEQVLIRTEFSHDYLDKPLYSWQSKIKNEIINATGAWKEAQRIENELKEKKKNADLKGFVPHVTKGRTAQELFEEFIERDADIENYKGVGLILSSRAIDLKLSIIMYSIFETKDNPMNPRWVNPDDFQADRKPLLDALIKIVYKKRKNPSTTISYVQGCIDLIRFLNENTLSMPLNTYDARIAIQEYALYLNARVLQGTDQNTAKNLFRFVKAFIKVLLPSEEDQTIIFRKINLGFRGVKTQKSTSVDFDEATYALSYYYHFFHKITDFILDEKPFPQKIRILDMNLQLAPWGKTFIINEDLIYASSNPWIYFDPKGERIFSKSEMLLQHQKTTTGWNKLSPREKQYLKDSRIARLRDIEHKVIESNSDPMHQTRILLAERAMQAFFMFFSSVTGMKDSELANIEWGTDDDIEVVKGAGKLVTIKPRAGYKEIESTIHRFGIYSLRKALKLRRYLLQGNECSKLFFMGHGDTIKIDGSLVVGHYGAQCIARHKIINPVLPSIGTRQFKVFKNKIILEKTGGDLLIAAALLGHKPEINAQHYQNDTQEKMDTELAKFVEAMVSTIKKDADSFSVTSTPQSQCKNIGIPESFIKDKRLDCNNMFACFFCKHFRVSPEKEDIHKLISLRFIILRISAGRSYDQTQLDAVLEPVEEIIEKLLKVMAKKYGRGELINTLQDMVFKRGMLHPYWEFKLRYLREIGAF